MPDLPPAWTSVVEDGDRASSGGHGVWTIGPRRIPPPAAASAHMVGLLAAEPSPALRSPELLQDLADVVAAADAKRSELAQLVARAAGVTVTETVVAGVSAYQIDPLEVDPRHTDQLFVHVHGGGWILGAGRAGTFEAVRIAEFLRIPVLSVNYRLAPHHPAPAAVDDVIAVWRSVVAARPAASVALGGSSAGANIVLATLLRLRAQGIDWPGAVMLGTPACDVTKTGDTWYTNEGIDHTLVAWNGIASTGAALYTGDLRADDVAVSPINGDFSGFPPTYLISGTRDVLLSDTVRTHRKLRRAGAAADLHVYEGLAHGDYLLQIGSPEEAEHYTELGAFLTRYLTPTPARKC